MYYQTTSCTTQVYQTCSSGCNGNSCSIIATSTATSTLVTNPVTSVQASSTMDLLNAFSSGVTLTAAPVGTATPLSVILNSDTSNVAQIASNGSSTIVNAGTISSIQPLTSQQTFTSGDLGNGAVSSNSTQSTSAVLKILGDLKAALVWAINYLNPFSATK